jgi:hypothetical protein
MMVRVFWYVIAFGRRLRLHAPRRRGFLIFGIDFYALQQRAGVLLLDLDLDVIFAVNRLTMDVYLPALPTAAW